MADEQVLSKRIGLTPGKAVLIGVLAVTLMSVIYIQYGPAESETSIAIDRTAAEKSPPRRPPQAGISESPEAAATDESGRVMSRILEPEKWKSPDVSTIVAYDPFALPLSFPQSVQVETKQGLTSKGIITADAAARASQLADAVAKLQTELEALRQRGVSVIVKQRDHYVAMIGDRTVHVGDEINGFTVTAIEPDGVRVEKKVTE